MTYWLREWWPLVVYVIFFGALLALGVLTVLHFEKGDRAVGAMQQAEKDLILQFWFGVPDYVEPERVPLSSSDPVWI